ncbi:hypothetical protein QYH69_23920 [Paraburkholderia sp. SARCC-3016]|uniref:hypothetical protein n=1 Tax=Paraburkholderia sp. SARCC-3016 TaxID=3058611 RepID=UPI00280A37A6|nr:hypothetical protein [Paraburkholderia sp. SARCC-3016]MDQ7980292.1 hypothetical protein [Paraburkholderia sp. SARCC-3016]
MLRYLSRVDGVKKKIISLVWPDDVFSPFVHYGRYQYYVEPSSVSDAEITPDTYKTVVVCMEISSPVSIALHPSGEMDVIFCNLARTSDQQTKERIRFTPFAASQFLDAIHAAVRNGNIHFGVEQETFH